MCTSVVGEAGHHSIGDADAEARNTRNVAGDALRPVEPCEAISGISPPVVAPSLLSGDPLSFLEFLLGPAAEDYCALLMGDDTTSAGKRLREFRKAAECHYFGYRRGKPKSISSPKGERAFGKLTAPESATSALLKRYARLAYRNDPERRGVRYWQRIAWLLWHCYATLMALRRRAVSIEQQERKRIARLPAKHAARARYMRDYRTRRRAKAARYFKPEAREAWRQGRTKANEEVSS